MKILLPVDGTELSLHETRFALQLLREGLKASFVLANVQEPASFYEMVTADSPELIEGAALRACCARPEYPSKPPWCRATRPSPCWI